jgi:hypothetical protein
MVNRLSKCRRAPMRLNVSSCRDLAGKNPKNKGSHTDRQAHGDRSGAPFTRAVRFSSPFLQEKRSAGLIATKSSKRVCVAAVPD